MGHITTINDKICRSFDNPEVNKLLIKHFIELKAASEKYMFGYKWIKDRQLNFGVLGNGNVGCGALKFLDKEHGEFK